MAEEQEVCTKLSSNVKMAGFLEKKGSMLWKRHWFVLEGQLLLFYKTQSEYINLSPCKGSVNMGLVSTVQPRRNSKEHIIHVVSRFNNLVLKAKDRPMQEKWLQALLDSIGKHPAPTKFSLENLREDIDSATLPRRLHGGSLDTVWNKGPILPKTKMLDKVAKYEEDPDENQNLDVFGSLDENQKKSLTLDNRHSETYKMSESTLGRLRSVITGRKSSATDKPSSRKPSRHESFISKMFRRGSSSGEVYSTPEPIEPASLPLENPQAESSTEAQDILRVESPVESTGTKTPEVPVTDSDLDDPLYDKIKPTLEDKLAGKKILLPAGTLAELKNRLRSKESLNSAEDASNNSEPPALPPRHSGNFETVEAVVHVGTSDAHNDSEDSELSGNYQVIRKHVSFEIPNNPLQITEVDLSDDSEASGHYQKIRKPVPISNLPIIVSEIPKQPLPEQEIDLPIEPAKTGSLLWNTMDSLNPPEPTSEVEYQVVNLEMKKKHRMSKAEEMKKLTPVEILLEGLPEITPKNIIVGMYPVSVDSNSNVLEDTKPELSDSFDSILGLSESMRRTSMNRTPAPARKSQYLRNSEESSAIVGATVEELLSNVGMDLSEISSDAETGLTLEKSNDDLDKLEGKTSTSTTDLEVIKVLDKLEGKNLSEVASEVKKDLTFYDDLDKLEEKPLNEVSSEVKKHLTFNDDLGKLEGKTLSEVSRSAETKTGVALESIKDDRDQFEGKTFTEFSSNLEVEKDVPFEKINDTPDKKTLSEISSDLVVTTGAVLEKINGDLDQLEGKTFAEVSRNLERETDLPLEKINDDLDTPDKKTLSESNLQVTKGAVSEKINGDLDQLEGKTLAEVSSNLDMKTDVALDKINDDVNALEEKTEETKKEMEVCMSELSGLLEQLAGMNKPPPVVPKTSSPETTQEDPDYDIPRPHIPILENCEDREDGIKATGFFSQIENTSSLEPDSLESKKES